MSTIGVQTPDQLLNANNPISTRSITLISGENVVRGAVLGKITASSKHNLSLSAAGDGSEVPDLIAAEDKDATAGDLTMLAYEKGTFNEGALTLGTAHTIASIREGLRVKGIFMHDASPA